MLCKMDIVPEFVPVVILINHWSLVLTVTGGSCPSGEFRVSSAHFVVFVKLLKAENMNTNNQSLYEGLRPPTLVSTSSERALHEKF